jgi:hypothetical protein
MHAYVPMARGKRPYLLKNKGQGLLLWPLSKESSEVMYYDDVVSKPIVLMGWYYPRRSA